MLALVLSGGGLWAGAAVGVLRGLEELGVHPDLVVGTSAGAVVGALYAARVPQTALETLVASIAPRDIGWAWRLWGRAGLHKHLPPGLWTAEPVWQRLKPWLGNRRLQDLADPLWITTTELVGREALVLGPPEGLWDEHRAKAWGIAVERRPVDLIRGLRAATAVPGLLPAVVCHGRVLVDGGLVDDYPVDIAVLAGADRVIGVWVDDGGAWAAARGREAPDLLQALERGVATMIYQITNLRQRACDGVARVDLRIEMAGGIRPHGRMEQLLEMGYHAVQAARDRIVALAT